MRKLWLTFAQATTIALAVLLVVSTLRPDLLPRRQPGGEVVTITQASAKPHHQAESGATMDTYSAAARKAMPSVVNISTTKEVKVQRHPLMDDPLFRRFFGEQLDSDTQRASSLGSGVIVGTEGYILTNNHVIEQADEIEVSLHDGRQARAQIVGTDPDTDLAVLRVELDNLPAITFGTLDHVNVGDVVLAIGNPFGVGQTVTMGIVSALERTHLGINTFENFIQTDAAINPGNSGGALVDTSGRLIGINTAILSPSGGSLGIGFAIPVRTANEVMKQLIEGGRVSRGWIGVEAQDLTPQLSRSLGLKPVNGALLVRLMAGGPGETGGLRPGDIVTAVDGKPVSDTRDLINATAAIKPGAQGEFSVLRDDKEVKVRVAVGRRPPITNSRRE